MYLKSGSRFGSRWRQRTLWGQAIRHQPRDQNLWARVWRLLRHQRGKFGSKMPNKATCFHNDENLPWLKLQAFPYNRTLPGPPKIYLKMLTQAHISRPTWSASSWTSHRRPSSSAAPATARFQPTSPTTTSSATEPRPPSTHAPTSTSQTAGPVKASGSSATSSLAREVRSVKPRSKIFRPLDG